MESHAVLCTALKDGSLQGAPTQQSLPSFLRGCPSLTGLWQLGGMQVLTQQCGVGPPTPTLVPAPDRELLSPSIVKGTSQGPPMTCRQRENKSQGACGRAQDLLWWVIGPHGARPQVGCPWLKGSRGCCSPAHAGSRGLACLIKENKEVTFE